MHLRNRRSRAGTPFTATGVCAAVVAAVSASIRRDWARATQDLIQLSGACPEWFRGRSPAMSVARFKAQWAHRQVLCRVLGEGPEQQLQLRFSLSHPVPAPPHVPQGVQGGLPPPATA